MSNPQFRDGIEGSVNPPKKILLVGTFRSGTNAMRACLENHYDVEVTFNEWFWKHGPPPTGIQHSIPLDVAIIVMSKSPEAFHESLYPFWLYRRPNLDAGPSVSEFARRELIVYDVSGGHHERQKYWYRYPIDYWNQFYFSWLSWLEVKSRCRFVRCEDLERSTDATVRAVGECFGLTQRSSEMSIALPAKRVGPHVPTSRKGDQFILNAVARSWIREQANSAVLNALGY